MFMFLRSLALAFVVAAALWAGARTAHAQAAPLSYWTPGWPLGFGGTADADQVGNSYANFPSFTATDARGFTYSRYNFGDGWFVGNVRGTTGLGGLGQAAAFGNFGSLTTEGTQFGYTFKNNGLPISVYGGLHTLKNKKRHRKPVPQVAPQSKPAYEH